MTILRNPRHERFAQELAAGKSAAEAYSAAGYRANTGNASTLRAQQSISKRVDEILAERESIAAQATERAIERTAITKERVLNELAKLGFANMLDYMHVGPSGDPVLNFADLTRDQAAALVEVTVEDFVDGRGEDARNVRRVKFKLADKRGALVDIGKEIGMFISRAEVKVEDLRETNDHDWVAQLLAQRRSRGVAAGDAGEVPGKPNGRSVH